MIFLPNNHFGENLVGGGFSFIRNFVTGAKRIGLEVTEGKEITPMAYDTMLIPGASMVDLDQVKIAKEQGKKVILRLDNILRESRNRGCGWSKMSAMYSLADVVVYQSEWAKWYVGGFFKDRDINKEHIIVNGVDQEIFNKDGNREIANTGRKIYLYSRHNRDELKGWERAWYVYQLIHREAKVKPLLLLTGKFSPDLVEYNFDFFNGEEVLYLGDINDPQRMARIYRSIDTLLVPYENDACSNTIIEAISCGVKDIRHNNTGGNLDIFTTKDLSCERMVREYGGLI